MESKIQKQIIDFFSFYEEFYNTSKSCLKICQNCAISINKVIHRCRNIKEAQVIGSPLEEFQEIQSKLLSALHNLISEDIQEIQKQRSVIEAAFESLCHKHQSLSESCRCFDSSPELPLIKGTCLQPPLDQILELAGDSLSYGAEICEQITSTLTVLSLRGLNTDNIVDSFKISSVWQSKVSEILAYTSFCSENQI